MIGEARAECSCELRARERRESPALVGKMAEKQRGANFLFSYSLCFCFACNLLAGQSQVTHPSSFVPALFNTLCTWINADNHCRMLSLSRVWMTKMRECTGGRRRTDFSAFSCEHVLNPLVRRNVEIIYMRLSRVKFMLRVTNIPHFSLQDIKHGFPHKPTAVAVDDQLKLMAVATKQGGIRV